MLIPYRIDVPFDHQPVVSWIVFAAIILVFGLQVLEQPKLDQQIKEEFNKRVAEGEPPIDALKHAKESMLEKTTIYSFVLKGWRLKGLFGHMWLHGGFIHLIGNLIFLWVFGNAVCSKIGNISYLPVYVGLGLISAISHLLFTSGTAIGASGAINGIVGMSLIFFPENELSCLWIFWFPLMIRPYVKTFSVRSFWLILMWFAFDIWGALRDTGHIAYYAHIGGFVSGAGLAILLLKLKWVTMEHYEKSLLQLISGEKSDKEEVRRDLAPWQQQYATSDAATSEPATIPLEEKKTNVEPEIQQLILEKPKEEFIHFTCSCGKRIKVPAKYAGKTGLCPSCKSKVKIPEKSSVEIEKTQRVPDKSQDEYIRFRCQCGQRIKFARKDTGKIGRCPRCKQEVRIPEE